MVSKIEKTSKKQRRDEIIKYLTDHPQKEEKEVLKHCLDKGIGSKVTVNQAIRELLEEGILDSGKERKNSKSYKLTVRTNNLLLIVPKDLDEIFQQFKAFIDKVKELEKVKSPINDKDAFSSNMHRKVDFSTVNVLSLLQYYLMEIINDVYLFYFVIILPYKLDDKDQITRLYSQYFDKITEMYSLNSDTSANTQPYDPLIVQHSHLRKYYIKSKQESLYSKLYEVAKKSEIIGLEEDLYSFLTSLMITDKDSAVSLYNLIERYNPNLLSKEKRKGITAEDVYDPEKLVKQFLFDIKNFKDDFATSTNSIQLPGDDIT